MNKKYFGTDGIRGKVGDAPMTPDIFVRLGYAAGRVLAGIDHSQGGKPPIVLIGKDTRISGYMLESSLEAGLSAAGVDVLLTGPMPTPAIAYLTCALRAQAGIVISASHNPYQDNGIKFFSAEGTKLSEDIELAIEAELEQPMQVRDSSQLGKVRRVDDAAGRYIEFCKSTFPKKLALHGLKIVVDCAHGATYHIAPHVFHELGAEVISIGAKPDGLNINNGFGSTQPQAMCQAVVTHKADLGIAFDGDGDRVTMADAAGQLLDGDQLLFIIAAHAKRNGHFKGGVVGTLMSNLGFEHALQSLDIPFERAKVGDRHVKELMDKKAWKLGGENSGHIICLDHHTSGDGIVSSLQVLGAMCESEKSLPELLSDLTMYPQVLINVEAPRRAVVDSPEIQAAVNDVEQELNGSGRVLLRASGTEPKIRVMVEGMERQKIEALAEKIADVVRTTV